MFPDDEVIVSGYSGDLVSGFSRFSRNLLRDRRYKNVFPNIELSKEVANVSDWGIEGYQGIAHWRGIGGSITGAGGNLIILDDFYKSREDAESEIIREKTWYSFTNDLLTRAAPVAIVIVLATPWHVDDIFGRIKEKMSDDPDFPKFEELKFPAFSDKYKTGTLFPERFPKTWYLGQRASLGSYGAASLLNCDPQLRTGNMIKVDNVQYVDEMPEHLFFGRAWDLASSEKQRLKDDPDWTIGVRAAINYQYDSDTKTMLPWLYIDDVLRFRKEAKDRNDIIKKTAIKDSTIVGIEAFAAYKDAYTQIRDELKGLANVRKLQLPGDKVAKASPLEAIFEAGHVVIKRASWNTEFLKVLSEFPSGKHDDDVDALACCYHMMKPFATSDAGIKELNFIP